MATSNSRLAYTDCFNLMDRALEDAKGARVKFPDYGAAWQYRLRLHTARRIDRTDNQRDFNESHSLHGRSIYDSLRVTIKRGSDVAWLYVEKVDGIEFEIENLSEVNGLEEAVNEPVEIDRIKLETTSVAEPIKRRI